MILTTAFKQLILPLLSFAVLAAILARFFLHVPMTRPEGSAESMIEETHVGSFSTDKRPSPQEIVNQMNQRLALYSLTDFCLGRFNEYTMGPMGRGALSKCLPDLVGCLPDAQMS